MKKYILSALLLMVASLQTVLAQGFRVYKSDGTFTQFSFRADSIVFYEGAGEDVSLGLFTPVNQIVEGKWYKSKSETVTFAKDGTTDYYSNGTYEYIPYQSEILVYNSSKVLKRILRVHKVTTEQLVVSTLGSTSFSVWTSTQPPQQVKQIVLNETEVTLAVNDMMTLTATVLPADADNPAVTWKSSDETVAKVISDGNEGIVKAISDGTCTITCQATDGSGVKAECQVTVGVIPEEHEWVDLGLPSGTLWATCNVGAEKPEDFGDYFAWGETIGYNAGKKTSYTWTTYKYCKGSETTMTKYCTDSSYGTVDNKTELDPEDDAATVAWGADWQMPSCEQMEELCYYMSGYTIGEWTTVNGVVGVKLTSKINWNSIFLPSANRINENGFGDTGKYAGYWTRSLNTSKSSMASRAMFITTGEVVQHPSSISDGGSRYVGLSIRPVRKQH